MCPSKIELLAIRHRVCSFPPASLGPLSPCSKILLSLSSSFRPATTSVFGKSSIGTGLQITPGLVAVEIGKLVVFSTYERGWI